jgi:hypothetical protein
MRVWKRFQMMSQHGLRDVSFCASAALSVFGTRWQPGGPESVALSEAVFFGEGGQENES